MAYPGARLDLYEPADGQVMAVATAPKNAAPLPAKRESGNHDCLLSSKGLPA